jgi:hypothetical protein
MVPQKFDQMLLALFLVYDFMQLLQDLLNIQETNVEI